MKWLKNLFKPKKNPHCECEAADCGAHIYYTSTGTGKKCCPTVLNRLLAPFREYPWNQIGVNGQAIVIGSKETEMRK